LQKNLRNSDFFCTFADGNEKQVSTFKSLEEI